MIIYERVMNIQNVMDEEYKGKYGLFVDFVTATNGDVLEMFVKGDNVFYLKDGKLIPELTETTKGIENWYKSIMED